MLISPMFLQLCHRDVRLLQLSEGSAGNKWSASRVMAAYVIRWQMSGFLHPLSVVFHFTAADWNLAKKKKTLKTNKKTPKHLIGLWCLLPTAFCVICHRFDNKSAWSPDLPITDLSIGASLILGNVFINVHFNPRQWLTTHFDPR